MKNHIAEDLPARKFAPAAAGSAPDDKRNKKDKSAMTSEERVSQAASDIRYKANLKDIPLLQQYNEYMQNSSMSTQERNIVKAKLFGKEGGGMRAEDFNISDFASTNIASALFKVFVEQPQPEISEEYIEELMRGYTKKEISRVDKGVGERKYKVRVTDKNTKKSYVRYATREKINQLRANPNIESVEMTEYGEPYEGERSKGSQTAKVSAGKGLDPVGQEDADVNNNGIKNDKSDKYLMKRRGAIGNAIAIRKEEFIHEAETEDSNIKKLDYKKGKVKNKVTITPTQDKSVGLMAHNELEGELIAENGYSKFLKKVYSLQEKSVSQNQQQLAGMALSYLRGEMPDASEEVKQMAKMGEKKLRDFAKTKHKGLPEKVKEEMECDPKKKKEVDNRPLATAINLAKNKVRAATGIKNPMIMVASEQAIPALPGENRPGSPKAPGGRPHLPGEKQTPIPKKSTKLELASYEPEGEVIDEEMPKRAKKKPSEGTTTFSYMGIYGRKQKQKKAPLKRIFSDKKDDDGPDDNDPRNHPSLSARERNPNLR